MASNENEMLYKELRGRFRPLKDANDISGIAALRDELIEEADPGQWPHFLYLGYCHALLGEEEQALACKEELGRLLKKHREDRGSELGGEPGAE